jgi:AhpD family alkylhydroperoxidase
VRLATAAPSLQSRTAPATSECSFDLMEATVRLAQSWVMSRRLPSGYRQRPHEVVVGTRCLGYAGRCADRPLSEAPGTRRARRPPARLPRPPLEDGLRLCLAYLEDEPERYEEAAAFWHARWCRHARGLTLADALSAREAVRALAAPGAVSAAEALRTLSAHHGLDDVAAVLGIWIAERGEEPVRVNPKLRSTRGGPMTQPLYPPANAQIAQRRKQLAPGIHDAFQEFSRQVFAAGALDEKTKQLIAVAVAHVTQCPYCIRGHTKAALRTGASEPELMEAIWVAAEMRAGGAYAHSTLALDAADHAHGPRAT